MIKFLLIRHGETEIEERAQKPENALSEKGILQACQTGERLKSFPLEHLYTSPYKRAWQTAGLVAKAYSAPLVPMKDQRLTEIGLWINPVDLLDDTSEEYKKGLAILNEAQKGVGELLQELKEKHKDETVAIVCHGNLIRAILGYALKMNLETVVRLKVGLASISVLEWDNEGYFRLSLFNDTCHLRN